MVIIIYQLSLVKWFFSVLFYLHVIYFFRIVSHLAPDEAKGPDWNYVDDCREWNTHDDEDEIGGCQSYDEDVGRVSHVLVGGDDHDHRQVPDEPERRDETEYDRNDDAHEVLEDDVRVGVDVFRRAVGRRRVVGQRRAGNDCCFRLHRGDVTFQVSADEDRASERENIAGAARAKSERVGDFCRPMSAAVHIRV